MNFAATTTTPTTPGTIIPTKTITPAIKPAEEYSNLPIYLFIFVVLPFLGFMYYRMNKQQKQLKKQMTYKDYMMSYIEVDGCDESFLEEENGHDLESGNNNKNMDNNKNTKNNEKIEDVDEEQIKVTVLGVFVNLGLFLLNFSIGLSTGSASLLADGLEKFSDFISDGITLITIKFVAGKKADPTYRYGYNRCEHLGALFVSGFICIAGWEIGFHALQVFCAAIGLFGAATTNAASSSLNPANTHICLFGIIVTFIAKETLYQLTVRVGEKFNSPVVIANAWHHRADAISSMITLFGVVGVYLGFPITDPIGGLLVAGLILKTGIEMGFEASQALVDRNSLEEELETEIKMKVEKIIMMSNDGTNSLNTNDFNRANSKYFNININNTIASTINNDQIYTPEKIIAEKISVRALQCGRNKLFLDIDCFVAASGSSNISLETVESLRKKIETEVCLKFADDVDKVNCTFKVNDKNENDHGNDNSMDRTFLKDVQMFDMGVRVV